MLFIHIFYNVYSVNINIHHSMFTALTLQQLCEFNIL